MIKSKVKYCVFGCGRVLTDSDPENACMWCV